MSYTDSADNSTDKNIDAYLRNRNVLAASKADPPDGGTQTPPQGKDQTQPGAMSEAQFDKMLQSMPKMPAAPKLHDLPTPTEQNYKSPYDGFSGPIMFLATLASLATRHPAQTAMNSFSAMINANVKGQKQQMDEARENWKESMEWTAKQNEVEVERYKMVMEKYKEDSNRQAAAMMAAASGLNDPMMAAMVRTGDMGNVWNYIQDLEKRGQQLAEFTEKVRVDDSLIAARGGTESSENRQARIDAIGSYRAPPISPANRSPINQQLMEDVYSQYPDYDATKYNAKNTGATTTARVGATRSTNLELIQRNLEKAIPQAEQASAKLPRGDWVPVNQLIQKGQLATSDPRYYEFAQTNLQVAELWARAMNPTGIMREGDRDLALSILGTATSPETYQRQLQVLRQFVQRERQATQEFREGTEPPAPGNANPDLGPTDKSGWSIEKVQ